MSQILNLFATPEISLGLSLIVLAGYGLSLVGYVSRGRTIASLTKERDAQNNTVDILKRALESEQAACIKVADHGLEVGSERRRLKEALTAIYQMIGNEAKRRGMYAGEATSKAYREAYNNDFKEMLTDDLLHIFSDAMWIAERVISLGVEERHRLEEHDKKICEEIERERANISYGGYVLAETCGDLPAIARVTIEKHIHFDQVNALIHLSTTCLYLKMSAEAYALELDKITERDRHVLRRFLELDHHLVHRYPEDYLLVIRRLAS